ncbi:DUF1768-domain-containing protein [Rickenella mellea]|uniref:DUF1768-domain-containing protein n=1 Tax=Rickenella mellea TaxID=50990 RepID=A0A4Y7QEB1_9AGAM|nr:DUF1768-domain-containing protein [Rickenella mellea]
MYPRHGLSASSQNIIQSPSVNTTPSPSDTSSAPLEYRIEDYRRTVIVTSAVPPEQWDEKTLREISQLSIIPEDTGSLPCRRTQSCLHSEVHHVVVPLEHEESPPSTEQQATTESDQSLLQNPRISVTLPERRKHHSFPGSPRNSLKMSPSPRRERIYFYNRKDPHYGFTNFSPHPVEYQGKVYPTSEHLFQSFKFRGHRPLLAEHIRTFSERPSMALSEARRFQPEVRRDWMQVNIAKMDETLWHKFNQHLDLRQELLDTGDAELIEDSDKDSFWGVGADRSGRNELGKALERLRSRLLGGW